MAKSKPSILDDMPSNVVKVHKMPATETTYYVLDNETGKKVYTENRAWYAYEKARSLTNAGKNVEVYGWDDTVGRHRPVGEFKNNINAHGDREGDWYKVATQRFEDAKAKRTGKVVDKTERTVKGDEETADEMRRVSQVLQVNSSNMRRGNLSGDDITALFNMVQQLSDRLYELTPTSPAPTEEE